MVRHTTDRCINHIDVNISLRIGSIPVQERIGLLCLLEIFVITNFIDVYLSVGVFNKVGLNEF